jgi:hypothetical protein
MRVKCHGKVKYEYYNSRLRKFFDGLKKTLASREEKEVASGPVQGTEIPFRALLTGGFEREDR